MFCLFRMFRSPWEGVAALIKAITARAAMAPCASRAGQSMRRNHAFARNFLTGVMLDRVRSVIGKRCGVSQNISFKARQAHLGN